MAWYSTRQSDKAVMTRAQEILADGKRVEFPRPARAGFLIRCMEGVGFCGAGSQGIAPITAQELSAWASGTGTPLGPIDFQDMLDASAIYVAAFHEYDRKPAAAPWAPEMTEEEALEAKKAEERYFDMLMGVA